MCDEEIRSLINRRRKQIIVHSIIYYRLNDNLISDYQWSQWAVELDQLQKQYPEIASQCCYAEEFKDFDPSTGYNLPLGDPKLYSVATHLLEYCRGYRDGVERKENEHMKIENWCGNQIRFVEHGGEWWAVLKDVCAALDLRAKKVSERLNPEVMTKVQIDGRKMIIINEIGIYQTLFASRKVKAEQFRMWTGDVLRKLRKAVGLEGYQVFRMTDEDVQHDIDRILDTIYWDEEKQCVMQSVTLPGGDVDQVPFGGF